MKKKIMLVICSLAIASMLAAGYCAVATEYGTQGDPLVTLSYINDVFRPNLMAELEKLTEQKLAAHGGGTLPGAAQFSAALDTKIAGYEADFAAATVDKAFSDAVTADLEKRIGAESAAEFEVVSLDGGKTVICAIGSEIILRLGSASCYAGGAPGLIDLSSASELANGKPLATNHMYLVTMKNRGFTAKERSTVLVRGQYTIS